MGFVTNDKGDDALDALGGQTAAERESKGDPAPTLRMDLDLKACEVCRRELLPWQKVCPDDGGRGVPRETLPPKDDPLARLLMEQDDELAQGAADMDATDDP